MSIKEITINEMFKEMNKFLGRHIEIDLSPIQSQNTYHWFSFKEVNQAIEFIDLDNDHPQLLSVFKDDILEIIYSEGKNIFDSVFTLNMKNDQQIQICVFEEPIKCYRCQRIVNFNKNEFVWKVDSSGDYFSHFDGDKLSLKICDDCMYEFVYGEKYVDLDNSDCEDYDYGLDKEKTYH